MIVIMRSLLSTYATAFSLYLSIFFILIVSICQKKKEIKKEEKGQLTSFFRSTNYLHKPNTTDWGRKFEKGD